MVNYLLRILVKETCFLRQYIIVANDKERNIKMDLWGLEKFNRFPKQVYLNGPCTEINE